MSIAKDDCGGHAHDHGEHGRAQEVHSFEREVKKRNAFQCALSFQNASEWLPSIRIVGRGPSRGHCLKYGKRAGGFNKVAKERGQPVVRRTSEWKVCSPGIAEIPGFPAGDRIREKVVP